MLDTTYCKNDSKQINIRKYSRQPVSLQIVCCYVFCILSNLPRATIKLSHCANQSVICLRRLAAWRYLFLEKGIKKLLNIPGGVDNFLQTVMNPRARQPKHLTELAQRHINIIPPSVSKLEQIIGQQAELTARLELVYRI